MKRIIVSLLVASLAYVGMLQCVGSFGLTRKWHGFVQSFGNKWISEIVFLITVIIPVYGICMLVDAILLNLIEFWGGSNPVAYDENGEHKKVVTKGDERIEMHYTGFGKRMHVRMFKNGKLTKTLLLKKEERGVIYALNKGEWKKISGQEADLDNGKILRILEGDEVVHQKSYGTQEYADMKAKSMLMERKAFAAAPALPGSL